VLDALPDLGPYELRLGHSQIFAAAVAGLGLPPEVSPSSVMALLAAAITVSASHPASDAANGTHAGAASAGTHNAGGSSSSGAHSHAAAAAGHAGGAAGAGSSSAGAGAGSSSSGRANVWPAVRVGLDGLGLDSKPVSRCRQCVLKMPGKQTSAVCCVYLVYAACMVAVGVGHTACEQVQAVRAQAARWVNKLQLLGSLCVCRMHCFCGC
jgi:hypothetical protein